MYYNNNVSRSGIMPTEAPIAPINYTTPAVTRSPGFVSRIGTRISRVDSGMTSAQRRSGVGRGVARSGGRTNQRTQRTAQTRRFQAMGVKKMRGMKL